MSLAELFIIAVGLSMDAFAVSVCIGLASPQPGLRRPLTAGLYFGGFQALMPMIGFFIGTQFADKITAFDHWLVFALLGFIGGKMIWESRGKNEEADEDDTAASLLPGKMLPMAFATSVDALAVGVSFAFLNVSILPAITAIGGTTLVLSMAGVKIGSVFGVRYKSKAELAGGVVLVLMGAKILAEHLGFL